MLREVPHSVRRPSLALAALCALALHAGLGVLLGARPPAPDPGSGPRAALLTRSLPAAAALPSPADTEAARSAPPQPRPRAAAAPLAALPDDASPSPSAGAGTAAKVEPWPAPTAAPVRGQGQLSYRFTQGQAEGQARLSWEVGDERYQLQLERELAGRALPGWRSEGRVDALHGLAPARFATQRGGRDRQAINFRREQGLISFSASAELQVLPDGVQDRLSWWLQLPALLAAQPGRLAPGQHLVMPVAGMRGMAADWVFRVEGREADGLWHLSRQALGPYDSRLEVWLDPQRRFLPVRVRQSVGDEERWEMRLSEGAGSEDSPNP